MCLRATPHKVPARRRSCKMQLGCYKVFRIFQLVTLGYCPIYKNIQSISRSTSTSIHNSCSPLENFLPVNKPQLEFEQSLSLNSSTSTAFCMERRKISSRSSMHRVSRRQRNVSRRIRDKILGRTYNTWTVALLRTFLRHYGRSQPHGTSKTHLMQVMNHVARDFNLEDPDYDDMYSAYWGRQDLPARKPLAATLRPAAVAGHAEQASLTSLPGDSVSPMPTVTLMTLPSRIGKSKAICMVCWDDLTTDTTPTRAVTSDCTHEVNVCRPCVSKSISSQLDSKMWDKISCPTCKAQMQFADVERLASPPVFVRYDRPSQSYHLEAC